jgi:plasmid maintenance system killer protein
MDVTFSSTKLGKVCNSGKTLRGTYGPRMADVVQRRLSDLAAAANLEEMKLLPGRCHELTENLKGRLAIDLVHPYRLVFEPNHSPRPQLASGGLDWGNVTRVTVVAIIDYHA